MAEREPAEAARLFRKAMSLTDQLPESLGVTVDLRRERGYQHAGLAYALQELGDRAASRKQLQQALEIRRATAEADPARTEFARELLITYTQMGDLLFDSGDRAGAAASYGIARGMAEKLTAEHPSNMILRRDVADCYERLARLECSRGPQGRYQAAEWQQKALRVWRGWSRFGVSSVFDTRRAAQAAQALAGCDASQEGRRHGIR